MQRLMHALPSTSPGTARHLISLHFGERRGGAKAYLQASLHADEPPGMLVMHHLRGLLEDAEAQGKMAGEVVLVPLANPIGMSQRVLSQLQGRFELNAADNFNRNYPDLLALIDQPVIDALGDDPIANRDALRAHLGAALSERTAHTEVDAMRLALVRLAYDADLVLDLHCDNEAVMHLYTETPYWPACEPLARYLGAKASLLAEGSGSANGGSFDEAISSLWWRLPRLRAAAGLRVPALPLASFAVTVELRGQADVTHALAREDAAKLFAYLCHAGLIDSEAPPLPELLVEPTPLAGSIPIYTPHGGVLTFTCELGSHVDVGTPIAEVIDVLAGQVSHLSSPVSGVFYARTAERMTYAHQSVARVAGHVALRTGALLTP